MAINLNKKKAFEAFEKRLFKVTTIWLLIFIPIVMSLADYNYYYAYKSQSWPSTDGKIISSLVKLEEGTRDRSYTLKIRYSYEIENKTYESEQISFTLLNFRTKEEAAEKMKIFTQKSPLDVKYNPANPQQTVLQSGLGREDWVFLIGFFCFFLFVAYLQYYRLYRLKS